MKVTHICLTGAYTDGWSYQDNLLSKYHKKLGYDVSLITNRYSWSDKGTIIKLDTRVYRNEIGIKVIRLKSAWGTNISSKLKKYRGLYRQLEQEKSDVLFIHGLQFIDMLTIIKYLKKNPKVRVYADNHADFSNSAKNWLSKNILHRILWKFIANKIEPFTEKIYGVTPARVDFLTDMYDINRDKIELLVLGADDDKVEEANNLNVVKNIRQQYAIEPQDFLIMTGGKIDLNKKETLLLMEAVNVIEHPNVKLMVFGSVSPELEKEFMGLLTNKIQYIGWLNPNETYNYFNASDLIVFPGLHSLFWEQVVGLGKPCIFRYIEGFTHVDLGGNCKFLHKASVKEIKEVVTSILDNEDQFEEMKKVASIKGKNIFSYKNIAERSIANV